ncbi:MAG: PqiC family protein [Candidatus Binataceae bacterium]
MNMKIHRLSRLIGASACVAAAACSFMAPQPDLTQYFILSPTAPSSSSATFTASTARLSVGVGPISFPGYLRRPGVVTRTTSNRLIVSDEKRWGEPLDRNFESVLGQNLSQILGTRKITNYPWYADTHIDYQVAVWVERFEAAEDGRSWLTALWTIKDGQDGHELAEPPNCRAHRGAEYDLNTTRGAKFEGQLTRPALTDLSSEQNEFLWWTGL